MKTDTIMKKLFLAIISAAVLYGCSNDAAIDKANIALIKEYVAAVEKMDHNVMSDYLADSYQGIGPSVSDSTNKESAVAAWEHNSQTLYEKLDYKNSRYFSTVVKEGQGQFPGHWVTNFSLLEISYKNGDKAQLLTNTSYLIEDGKIARTFTFYNEADVLEQLNYVFIDLDDL